MRGKEITCFRLYWASKDLNKSSIRPNSLSSPARKRSTLVVCSWAVVMMLVLFGWWRIGEVGSSDLTRKWRGRSGVDSREFTAKGRELRFACVFGFPRILLDRGSVRELRDEPLLTQLSSRFGPCLSVFQWGKLLGLVSSWSLNPDTECDTRNNGYDPSKLSAG